MLSKKDNIYDFCLDCIIDYYDTFWRGYFIQGNIHPTVVAFFSFLLLSSVGKFQNWQIILFLMFLPSQKQMTGQIPDDCMYEFQPFCLVLNSIKMTVFLIKKNKKVYPVLNSPTDYGGEKCKNKMGVSIFL